MSNVAGISLAGLVLALALALGGPLLSYADARTRRAYGSLMAGVLVAAAAVAAWLLVPRRATAGTTPLIAAVALPVLVAASIALAIRQERERQECRWVPPAVFAGFPALAVSAAVIAFTALSAANERSQ